MPSDMYKTVYEIMIETFDVDETELKRFMDWAWSVAGSKITTHWIGPKGIPHKKCREIIQVAYWDNYYNSG